MSQVRAHVFITGKVQGVGYRYYTEQAARQAGVRGWVRNLKDGRVEAVFEGDRATVEAMLRWCHQGAPTAIVDAVTVEYEPIEDLLDFQIRHTA